MIKRRQFLNIILRNLKHQCYQINKSLKSCSRTFSILVSKSRLLSNLGDISSCSETEVIRQQLSLFSSSLTRNVFSATEAISMALTLKTEGERGSVYAWSKQCNIIQIRSLPVKLNVFGFKHLIAVCVNDLGDYT